MANAIEARLDKYLMADRIDRAARLIQRETKTERVIVERRQSRRVPGAVQFIPRDWLDNGRSESYASRLLPL